MLEARLNSFIHHSSRMLESRVDNTLQTNKAPCPAERRACASHSQQQLQPSSTCYTLATCNQYNPNPKESEFSKFNPKACDDVNDNCCRAVLDGCLTCRADHVKRSSTRFMGPQAVKNDWDRHGA